jgi:UDP-N-acetylmuramoyl-tripeptide--D-alanyl-D-alanine ligase
MNAKEIAKALAQCIISSDVKDVQTRELVIDSRLVKQGDIFAAFNGENTDGNLYAAKALELGASVAIVTDSKIYDQLNGSKILVKDALEAIKAIGTYKLSAFKGTKVAITGSMGKTSTKELVSGVLATAKRVYTAYGNYNNELGTAVCAASLDIEAEFAVFELGTNSRGEIAELSRFIKPDVAVLTGIGHAHIGRMGGIKELATEKLSITEGMNGGTFWISEDAKKHVVESSITNVNIKYFGTKNADITLTDKARNAKGQIYFTANYESADYCFLLGHPYDHFAHNALAAIAIGFEAGISYEDIMHGIMNFKPVKGRGQMINLGSICVIDDTYNAGFESVASAIKNFSSIDAVSKHAIIGEIGEIEGFEHTIYTEIYKLALQYADVNFIFVGEGYLKFAETAHIAIAPTKAKAMDKAALIKDGLVLIKASRSKKFEDFIKLLEQENKTSAV